MTTIFWILVSIVAIIVGMFIVDWWQSTEESRASADFRRSSAARGLSSKDRQRELLLRTSLARVRRLASERAALEPGKAWDIIPEEIDKEVKRLGTYNKSAAYQFLKASGEWLSSDILYPDVEKLAFKALKLRLKTEKLPAISAEDLSDHISAMKGG